MITLTVSSGKHFKNTGLVFLQQQSSAKEKACHVKSELIMIKLAF